jgi:tRNA uridine 5-carboxymethylaminomethyl modification enzyme
MIAQVGLKYQGYIAKEKELADKLERLETVHLHKDFDYQQITSISAEAREKLSKIKPRTIGQASRISGVTPADVSILLVHVGR